VGFLAPYFTLNGELLMDKNYGQSLRNSPNRIALALLVTLFAVPALAREEKGTTFDARSATVYYEVMGSGSGVPLIIVNGGPGFDHTYEHVSSAWDVLAKKRRVIFYDQRGTGRSPASKGQTYTLADQINDLEDLRAHLGADHIDLLGHSWGGYLVMAYAAEHPEHIAHLIIVDSAAPKFKDTVFLFDNVFPEGTERQAAFAFKEEMGDKASQDADLHEYFSMLFYSPQNRDKFLATVAPSVYKKDINEAVEKDIERFDLNPEIRKFKFPTLVITGRYDMNVAPVVAYKIHQAIAGSRFAVFEKSGHLPFFEEPEEFVQVMEEFLEK
jgi:proline iminopeptidase